MVKIGRVRNTVNSEADRDASCLKKVGNDFGVKGVALRNQLAPYNLPFTFIC